MYKTINSSARKHDFYFTSCTFTCQLKSISFFFSSQAKVRARQHFTVALARGSNELSRGRMVPRAEMRDLRVAPRGCEKFVAGQVHSGLPCPGITCFPTWHHIPQPRRVSERWNYFTRQGKSFVIFRRNQSISLRLFVRITLHRTRCFRPAAFQRSCWTRSLGPKCSICVQLREWNRRI